MVKKSIVKKLRCGAEIKATSSESIGADIWVDILQKDCSRGGPFKVCDQPPGDKLSIHLYNQKTTANALRSIADWMDKVRK